MLLRLCHLVLAALIVSPALHADPLVIVAKPATAVERRYLAFLQTELDARHVDHRIGTAQPANGADAWIIGTAAEMRTLLKPQQYIAWRRDASPQGSEGYSVANVHVGKGHALLLTGATARGELFAIGWLLRTATVQQGRVTLPRVAPLTSTPAEAVRGYQIGYRSKNNTYDAWTLAQFQQQMLDLAVFGLNTMQVVAPVSDDAPTSPLFPAPAEQTVVALSRLSQQYGLRYDLFYPEMAKDYTDPKQASAELTQFENLVQQLPQLDSIHIPGGDPGHTAPEVLLPLIEREARILHRYHPSAKVWVSAQGFTAERFARFYQLMQSAPFVDGVFFGPQSRNSMEEQRRQLPARVPLEFYPDTAHTMHAQFPVPEWDPVFQLVEGREPVCPRPAAFEHIFQHFQRLNTGFIVYSEGVNDDVNKILWGGLGWDPARPVDETLRDYARYFFGAANAEAAQAAHAIEALEQNWTGPLSSNTTIAGTLTSLHSLQLQRSAGNWRWNSLLYRATYDRYLQLKRARELDQQQQALAALMPEDTPAGTRIARSRQALAGNTPGSEEQHLRAELEQLAGTLFHEVGLQLSVSRFGASNWERGANFDRVDTPLNDRTWLEARLAEADVASATERDALLQAIVHWTNPAPGSLYDDLGDPRNEPHLERGSGWTADPELYQTAIDGIADTTLERGWRLSWLTYAETLYEQPLRLHYMRLDPDRSYRIRITYAGEDYHLPMQLRANGIVVQPYRPRRSNPEQVQYDLPAGCLKTGDLDLEWTRPFGAGGGGRGGQVAEVWLLPAQP